MMQETVEIDEEQKVRLPNSSLDQLNLRPGDKLEFLFDEKSGHLQIHHAGISQINGGASQPPEACDKPDIAELKTSNGKLIRKGKSWVYKGEFTEPITLELMDRLIQKDRDRVWNETLKALGEK